MKKKNTKSRAIIIYALCGGLMVSLFSPVTTGFAEDVADAVDQITTKILGKPDTTGMLEVPNLQLSTVATQNDELAKAEKFTTDEQVVHTDVEVKPQINQKAAKSLTVDTKSRDLFNLTQEQMEELINKGYTVEDIYKVDELANRLLVEPEILIERKEKSGETWERLEAGLTLELETADLQKLVALYPAEYTLLQKNGFNAKEQITLLRAVDLGVGSIEELMPVYKAQGEKGLGTYQAKQQAAGQKNGAKSAAPAIDGKVLERLKQVSEQTGVPLDQLTEQFIAARNLSKQVLVERE